MQNVLVQTVDQPIVSHNYYKMSHTHSYSVQCTNSQSQSHNRIYFILMNRKDLSSKDANTFQIEQSIYKNNTQIIWRI